MGQPTVHVSPECRSAPRSPLPSRSVARSSCSRHGLSVHRPLELAEHADRGRLGRPVRQVCQRERERRTTVHVVHHDRVLGHVGGVRDHEPAVVPDHDAPGPLVEHDRLSVHQADLVVDALRLLPQHVERTVVEHVAVLIDLDERRPLMRDRLSQDVAQVLPVVVEGARHERGLGAQRHRDRVERMVHRAERRGLRDLALLAGRRVLALREAVDLVVEQQDLEVHVAPERVDQVVAADRQAVAVAGDDPDRQLGVGGGDPGRERRRPPVDPVHAVRVHVVAEPPAAADPGDEHRLVRFDAELGHQPLDGRQDRVVAAPRAPADLLVRREVLLGQRADDASRLDVTHGRAPAGSPAPDRPRRSGCPGPW